MILKTNEGPKEIKTKELDFTNVMCDLEDNGVDVMGLLDDETREKMKVFSTMRAIMAAITGTKDLEIAGKMISEHLKNGGDMNDIMNTFTEVMASAGFGKDAETKTETLPVAEADLSAQASTEKE